MQVQLTSRRPISQVSEKASLSIITYILSVTLSMKLCSQGIYISSVLKKGFSCNRSDTGINLRGESNENDNRQSESILYLEEVSM